MLNINKVLSNLNTNYSQVTDIVPEIFYFTDDVSQYQSNNITVFDTVVQDDGNILVAGEGIAGFSNNLNGQRRGGIMRIDVNGVIDETYTRLGFDYSGVFAIDLQSTGKAIVGGYFTNVGEGFDEYSANNIVRLGVNGYPDYSFNIGIGFNSSLEDIIVLSDDSILTCGYFDHFNEVNTGYLTKLNSDGTLDTTFNTNFINNGASPAILAMAVQSDNKIVYVGSNGFVSRINSNGLYDETFTNPTISGYNNSVSAVAIQDDGKILIGGSFNTVNGNTINSICRLNSDGSFDESFEPSGNGFQGFYSMGYDSSYILEIKIQSNGKILVGGYFNSYNSKLRNNVCRLNSDGSLDSSFGNPYNFDAVVFNINYISSNEILVGGSFRHPRIGLAKLTNTGSFSSLGINLPDDTYGIEGGFDTQKMYNHANFINTNNTQLYNDIKENDVNSYLSVPCTHVQATFPFLYDASSPYLYRYLPAPLRFRTYIINTYSLI